MQHAFTRFMRAHGQMPGPGERPRLAGALAGAAAGLISLPLLSGSGASSAIAAGLGTASWTVPVLYSIAAMLAGVVYATVFGRAANDRRGGWLFGAAYGFLLWMLGPVTLLQAVLQRQLVVGTAAMGVLGASLASGLLLGVLFRPTHVLIRKQLAAHSRGSAHRDRPVEA
jgi:hypothetical protein